jgi:hypothetical protein
LGIEHHLAEKYGLFNESLHNLAEPATFTEKEKSHWAFQPPRVLELPRVENEKWAKTAVDRFVLAELESRGATPTRFVDKRTWLRRVTFDLIGLPPSPQEMTDFLADQSPQAYEVVVDRLLQSNHYGERWARHWLDVVRYAETTANDANAVMRYAWRYRNFVIDAFNNDMPYDQFLIEQLAGDLRVHLRGNRFTLGKTVRRGVPQVIGNSPGSSGSEFASISGSGRLELARWIADADNPLTARVMVNRIWQHHFGTGIVATSDNFGKRGTAPTNPELLDWLAKHFVESGWSVKAMQRMLVLSSAYRQSRAEQSAASIRRLSAEELRDSMLAVSGNLDRAPGGNESSEYLYGKAEDINSKIRPNRLAVDDPYYTTFAKRSIYLPVVRNMFPQIGSCIDDICVIRSMNGADQVSHGPALLNINTGSGVFARPSLGAWTLYGLGTENQNLPGFVSLSPSLYHGGTQNYGSAFLPATFQGTALGNGGTNFKTAKLASLSPAVDPKLQRLQLDLLDRRNRQHQKRVGEDARLEARIAAFEMGFRMQAEAPNVMDLNRETQKMRSDYGVDKEPTDEFARQCLMARRLLESGVRFVQVNFSYPRNYWDAHGGLRANHSENARKVDQPIAALIKDLKSRGMLDDTLVIFGTEFGRTPAAQGSDGRDHHPHAFSVWLAGGGIRGGMTYGQTDEFGYYVEKDKVSMPDFHATILHQLGLDHTQLTFRHAGRDYGLTDVHGDVVKPILG